MATAPRSVSGNSEWASRYAREIRGVIVRQASYAPRSLQVRLGPSELGAPCDRQVVGKLAAVTKTNHVSDPWPSIVGTAVHAWLATACEADNKRERVLRWITEQSVEPAPGYGGHADLYDTFEQAVVDWKILGPTSLSKIKSPEGPPQRYKVQLLLYGRGYRNLGLPVRRVAIAALPRTASTLDSMYIWAHNCGPDDEFLLNEVLRRTAIRQELAIDVREGRMRLDQVPITPDASECYFCPFYRPSSSYDKGPGCPGMTVPRMSLLAPGRSYFFFLLLRHARHLALFADVHGPQRQPAVYREGVPHEGERRRGTTSCSTGPPASV